MSAASIMSRFFFLLLLLLLFLQCPTHIAANRIVFSFFLARFPALSLSLFSPVIVFDDKKKKKKQPAASCQVQRFPCTQQQQCATTGVMKLDCFPSTFIYYSDNKSTRQHTHRHSTGLLLLRLLLLSHLLQL